ncbi:hypothetical protein [Microbulbifer sp. JSM ZJ756]|uniref:hypothetical protein n=1 Tax=Microbulbifer sp. JSM ZJ756 TaxID=3376191 RepID=UPI0037BA08B8
MAANFGAAIILLTFLARHDRDPTNKAGKNQGSNNLRLTKAKERQFGQGLKIEGPLEEKYIFYRASPPE